MTRNSRDRERYKASISLSKEHLDSEMRAIARKFSHRPIAEVIQIIREKTGAAIDPAYLGVLMVQERTAATEAGSGEPFQPMAGAMLQKVAMGRLIEAKRKEIAGVGKCRVDALRIGQRVDLELDIFADPEYVVSNNPDDSMHPEFQFEFEVVAEIDRETADCICVYFESGFSCGFPPDHLVDVDSEQQTEG